MVSLVKYTIIDEFSHSLQGLFCDKVAMEDNAGEIIWKGNGLRHWPLFHAVPVQP